MAMDDYATAPDTGYAFEELISNVPIKPDGADPDDDTHITCVEYWNGNLYIGTSAGELLHYVSLPPEPGVEDQSSTFIQASRNEPESNERNHALSERKHGLAVKQILLLPAVNKACILCGGTLTFYSLPELTPAFGGKIKQTDCNWVGGLDENIDPTSDELATGIVVVICLQQRLRLIRIGEQARKLRDIELPGCLDIRRRGDLACVADRDKYALIDVANQQKVDLFPISSASPARLARQSPPPPSNAQSTLSRPHSSSLSATNPPKLFGPGVRGHDRIVSLGAEPLRTHAVRATSPLALSGRSSSRNSQLLEPDPQRVPSPADDKPLPRVPSPAPSAISNDSHDTHNTRSRPGSSMSNSDATSADSLIPHVAAVSATEYLLTTGTTISEPGVGMFVNHDGDVVRGTIEFSSYPEALIIAKATSQPRSQPASGIDTNDDRVMTVLRSTASAPPSLFVQSWSGDQSEQEKSKEQVFLPIGLEQSKQGTIRLGSPLTGHTVPMTQITSLLALRRVDAGEQTESTAESDNERELQEDRMCSHFANVHASTIIFANATVWWIVTRPLVLRLDAKLDMTIQTQDGFSIARQGVKEIFNELRGQEAFDELEFHTLDYIRQKAALLLFIDLLVSSEVLSDVDLSSLLEVLVTSKIDPRIVLLLVPELRVQVSPGPSGIWLFSGLKRFLTLSRDALEIVSRETTKHQILHVSKLFLSEWRRKKGFGSVADESHVFESVDAGLLQLLLILDEASPRGPATAGSVRAELNEVVDRGVDCFDRAVGLLQHHRRLYVLSRLYQSRKLVSEVLSTWRRIIEGEQDNGGELVDGEADVGRYLSKIKDVKLVEEYGTWLARRRPALGVKVFADETSRVKFSADEALEILRSKAPNAVKEYLEHLVFDKHMVQHTNSLMTFYLDAVLHELDTSEAARSVLTESYDTYRALMPPKPTYEQFMTDNAVDADWFRNRLSLLQLIGGGTSQSHYNLSTLSERLEPYSSVLVPEMIILNGRRGHDGRALQLLTNGLGDYDTAIRYCLLGGVNVFGTLQPGEQGQGRATTSFREQQRKLFRSLLVEGLLVIPDEEDRQTRTAEVLEQYGAWFEIGDVLSLIPESWPVEALSGFISRSLRRLGSERRETDIVKALSGAQNVKQSAALIARIELAGVKVETDRGHDSAYHSMESR